MATSAGVGPRYLHIASELRAAIERGDYGPGARLPSLPDLAKTYGVSVVTAREAVRLLASQSYVAARQGLGTFVRPRKAAWPAVLVADDDAEIRRALREHAEAMDCRVVEVADTDAALQALERERFSHVFTDLRMPGAGGAAVIAQARKSQPGAVVVVVTGFPEDLAALPEVAEWPILILTKPFRAAHVRTALALRQATP